MSRERTEYVIVHKSKRPEIGTARDMDRWDRSRGFLKIGYHYFIRRSGEVERGRDLREPGAYSKEHNSSSIGVCLATEQDGERPTANQIAALDSLLNQLEAVYPNAKVLGRDTL